MAEIVSVNSEQEMKDLIDAGGRVVVLFTAPSWCPPCRQFEPHFERAAEEASEITFARVNEVDKQEWAMVAYGISSIPSAKLFESGEEIRDVKVPQGALPFLRDIRS